MADQKISDLPDGGDPQDTDDFVVARGATNNKVAWSSMSNAVVTAMTASQIAASADGNTAGALALVSSGTLILAGGNNITLSQAGNAITISGVSIPAESQTFIAAIQASNTTYTSGSVVLTGSGAATVRSGAGQQVIIDVPVQSTQAETQTFIAGISASDTLYTSGNVRLTGVGGGITISSNTGQRVDISVAAQTAQTGISGIANSQTTYTSGTVSMSELGAITIRSTTGNQYQFSVNAQSVQPETQTFVAGIQNSQTTYTSGTVNLSVNGGLMTIRSTTGQAFQFSVSQSVQAETQTFVGGIQNSQTTYTSGTVNLSVVAGNLTIRSTTGQAFQFSMSQTVQAETQTAISGIANSQTTYTSGTVSLSDLANITIRSTTGNQFQFSVAGTTGTGNLNAISNSNTTYTSGTIGLSELGAITIRSTTGNQFQFSVNSQTVQTQSFLSAGMSTNGNTSGDTGFVTGRLALMGGNNITLSGSTNAGSMSITISAPNLGAGAMSAGVSTGGNTAGATGITGTQLVLVGSGPISLSQTTGANGGTVSINAPATSSLSATGLVSISTNGSTISVGVPYGSAAAWENMPAMEAVLYTHVSGVSKTPFYWIENLPQGIKPANVAMRVSMVTASADLSMSIHFGVYTFVNSTSAALLGSGSDAFVVSNGSSVSFSGQRNLVLTSPGTVAAISSLTPGNYLFGAMFSATATGAMNASVYAASAAAGPRLGLILPGTNQLSTATSQGIAGLYGRGSTTVNVMPANVVASEVVNQGIGASSPMKPYIFIRS
jgi:hypothetical protein